MKYRIFHFLYELYQWKILPFLFLRFKSFITPLHKKWSFSSRISSVNVIKPEILNRNNLFFVQCAALYQFYDFRKFVLIACISKKTCYFSFLLFQRNMKKLSSKVYNLQAQNYCSIQNYFSHENCIGKAIQFDRFFITSTTKSYGTFFIPWCVSLLSSCPACKVSKYGIFSGP